LSRPFHFKQFSIHQENAPMKVGTDGALLGAWAPGTEVKKILDIGTGTGLIALMLAQRFTDAHITAIEPNDAACLDAAFNFEHSPYAGRIKLEQIDLESFNPNENFDLIVSNPPFFQRALHAPDEGRTQARHALNLSPELLLTAAQWLNPKGIIAGIYPTEVYQRLVAHAKGMDLWPYQHAMVLPRHGKPVHRVLFAFAKSVIADGRPASETFEIENAERHDYSERFTELMRPFYLKL
jgi:tRNA1Val (adenine37-N6)-methyltransferase